MFLSPWPLLPQSVRLSAISYLLSFPRARNRLEMMERKPTEEKEVSLTYKLLDIACYFSLSLPLGTRLKYHHHFLHLFVSLSLFAYHLFSQQTIIEFSAHFPLILPPPPHTWRRNSLVFFLIFSTFQNFTIIKNSTSSARILIASLNRRFDSADFCKFFLRWLLLA